MAANTKVDIIIDGIRSRILSGEFGDEGRLPSFRKLVAEYDTSQETMNKAMQTLQAEGILLSAGAKGVFVNSSRIRIPGIVTDFPEHLKSGGLNPRSEFIEKPEIITPPEDIVKRMKLKPNEKVLRRQRKQGSDNAFFRMTTEYYSLKFINDQMLEEIYKNPHYNIVLAIKDNYKESIQFAEEEVVARLANAFEQNTLEIVRTNPVIECKSINFSEDKKNIILYFHKVLNANHFILTYNYNIKDWK